MSIQTLKKIYTDKQIEVLKQLKEKDWFMLGLHGAKRSGKTVLNNDVFLSELRRVRKIADRIGIKQPIYILAGTESKAIQNNIFQELFNRYGVTPKFDKHNSFELFGVKVVQVYTGSIAGLKSARGFTAYGAYINEASLANEQVFKEIVTRCSGEGARIVWDSNPDIPTHWLKKEYIDSDNPNYINVHFILDDNTFLSQRYIQNIKEATPSGMFYDRDINGLWVTGEGVVYPDFDMKKHLFKKESTPPIERYIAGVDWGYDHYGAIVVIGITSNQKYYIIEEHAKRLKEIDYWVDVAQQIRNKYGRETPFYCDSARPEHVARFQREGINAFNANKAVLSGIEEVSKLIKNDALLVNRDAKQFLDEIYQYAWDDKKGVPRKEHDDVMDAVRYAIYTNGRVGGKVQMFKGVL